MRHARGPGLLLLLVAAVLPTELTAQELRGVLVDRITQQPVAYAAVYLLHGEQVASRRLADATGVFVVPVEVGRVYRVRIEQLGFESFVSEPIRFDSVETRTVQYQIESRAVALLPLAVIGANRGCSIEDGGLALHTLWTEARKALAASQLTEELRLLEYQGVRYARRLDARAERVTAQETRPLRGRSPQPFRSLAASDLSANGYIRRIEGTRDFSVYAPDAAVLLSPAFLDDHCFSLIEGKSRSGEIGLRFEPVKGRRSDRVDIEGTFWLHRTSYRLQRLEFRYAGTLADQPFDEARGQVEFTAAPNGTWLISRWWIRMPLLETGRLMHAGGSVQSLRVSGFHEDGGYIERFSANGRLYDVLAAGSLAGRVHDGLTGQPLSSATVQLTGTNYRSMTDENGRFVLHDVYPGTYTIAWHHPSVDSLPALESMPVTVAIEAGTTANIDLAGPSLTVIRQSVCPDDDERSRSQLWGRVRRAGDGTPIANATVTIEWDSVFGGSGRLGASRVREVTRSDDEGRYLFCGVQAEVRVWIRASLGPISSEEQSLVIRSSHLVRDVLLDTAAASNPAAHRALPDTAAAINPSAQRAGNGSAEPAARNLDVRADRVLQRFRGVEPGNASNAVEEMHPEIAVVKILLEIEQVDFRGS